MEVAISGLDLEAMPEETLEDVERKRATWQAGLRDENPRPRGHARRPLRRDVLRAQDARQPG